MASNGDVLTPVTLPFRTSAVSFSFFFITSSTVPFMRPMTSFTEWSAASVPGLNVCLFVAIKCITRECVGKGKAADAACSHLEPAKSSTLTVNCVAHPVRVCHVGT